VKSLNEFLEEATKEKSIYDSHIYKSATEKMDPEGKKILDKNIKKGNFSDVIDHVGDHVPFNREKFTDHLKKQGVDWYKPEHKDEVMKHLTKAFHSKKFQSFKGY
jgi:hypothetical protein